MYIFYVKKIAIIMMVLIMLLLPITSMADTYYTDWSTETEIYLPSDWKEVKLTDTATFSRCFSDGKLDKKTLYYIGANTAYVIPMAYRNKLVKNTISSLVLDIKTTSYPMEMYSQIFEVPQEYISVVSIKGIEYIRIEEYKTQESRGKQDSSGLSIYYYNDVVWYVCVIKNTVYIYCFKNDAMITQPRTIASFENSIIPQYEQILANVKYKHIENLKMIGICAAIILLIAILIIISVTMEKRKQKVKAKNRLSEGNAERYDDGKHVPSTIKSYQPTQSISNTSQEPKTATVATDQHAEMKSPIASSENEGIQYCRKCGNRLLPDSVFCDKCGTKVQ